MKEEQWKHGPYLGLILKGYDPLISSEKSSKTDGFLNFTLTRAIKSSFQGPKSNKNITSLHMVIYFCFMFIFYTVHLPNKYYRYLRSFITHKVLYY